MEDSSHEHGAHCPPRPHSSWGWIFLAFGVFFALSYFKPKSARDWRTFVTFSQPRLEDDDSGDHA